MKKEADLSDSEDEEQQDNRQKERPFKEEEKAWTKDEDC